MKPLLIVLLALTSACAAIDVPEVGRDLRDYQAREPIEHAQAIPLPKGEGVVGEIETVHGPAACVPEAELDRYTAACQANTEALEARTRGVVALERENAALLAAGRAAEAQAELFRGLYVDEANHCRWVTAGAGAAGGFLLLVLGIGSL